MSAAVQVKKREANNKKGALDSQTHITYFYLSGSARGIENSIAPDKGNKIYKKSVARGADFVGRARLSAPAARMCEWRASGPWLAPRIHRGSVCGGGGGAHIKIYIAIGLNSLGWRRSRRRATKLRSILLHTGEPLRLGFWAGPRTTL